MKERYIGFNTAMTQATWDGVKTHTRRAIKPQQMREIEAAILLGECSNFLDYGKQLGDDKYLAELCPYGRPGDILKVLDTEIRLRIKSVRAERVQDISEADARAEGIREVTKDGTVTKYCIYDKGDYSSTPWQDMSRSAVECFKGLWDSIFKETPYLWSDNPWVWVIEFEVL